MSIPIFLGTESISVTKPFYHCHFDGECPQTKILRCVELKRLRNNDELKESKDYSAGHCGMIYASKMKSHFRRGQWMMMRCFDTYRHQALRNCGGYKTRMLKQIQCNPVGRLQ
ncbi:uncharacterized protein LOC132040865 isoform X2 [Lycium ferocissimum]|uniref:uncharacterized protein LOC132040865 isoform X2 n=1 Tax=Lycium ferocissimum TaxID=112874 RepID=UPI002814E8E3|nr:uncharacterized protein LOC132040865 isoform X2 [Lycium ferocissimum]